MSKAIDCVGGRVSADVSRALAPHGELIVYGALSTHRQTDPDNLTIPIFARSLIYGTKTVRGFWLFCWITETPKDRMAAAIDRTLQLADSGAARAGGPADPPRNVQRGGLFGRNSRARGANRCWYSNGKSQTLPVEEPDGQNNNGCGRNGFETQQPPTQKHRNLHTVKPSHRGHGRPTIDWPIFQECTRPGIGRAPTVRAVTRRTRRRPGLDRTVGIVLTRRFARHRLVVRHRV